MPNLLRQKRSQITREKLLRAASTMLNSGSEAEFSMPSVAKSAGKSVGTLYEHFPSKDALLVAVTEDYAARRDAFLVETFDEDRWAGSSRADRVDGFVRGLAKWYRENRGVLRLVILRGWSAQEAVSDASVDSFRQNIQFTCRFVCGADWTGMTPVQRRAAENAVHYAIVLARDALVVDDATQRILETRRGTSLEDDLIRIVHSFLDRVPGDD